MVLTIVVIVLAVILFAVACCMIVKDKDRKEREERINSILKDITKTKDGEK